MTASVSKHLINFDATVFASNCVSRVQLHGNASTLARIQHVRPDDQESPKPLRIRRILLRSEHQNSPDNLCSPARCSVTKKKNWKSFKLSRILTHLTSLTVEHTIGYKVGATRQVPPQTDFHNGSRKHLVFRTLQQLVSKALLGKLELDWQASRRPFLDLLSWWVHPVLVSLVEKRAVRDAQVKPAGLGSFAFIADRALAGRGRDSKQSKASFTALADN